jgi:hypothetical protein
MKLSYYDKLTGTTHSRAEDADLTGVIRGYYEVHEPDCVVRRVQYSADVESGFRVVAVSTRTCETGHPVSIL